MVMTPIPRPDLAVVSQVLLLADAIDAERRCRPAAPVVVTASSTLAPETGKERKLLFYLAALDDDHQAQLHALCWIGRDRFAGAEHYSSLYEYALTTDLGRSGAAYLAGKGPLADYLRSGLEKLGLVADQSQTHESDSQDRLHLQEDQNHD
jgi:hypothetical protein